MVREVAKYNINNDNSGCFGLVASLERLAKYFWIFNYQSSIPHWYEFVKTPYPIRS